MSLWQGQEGFTLNRECSPYVVRCEIMLNCVRNVVTMLILTLVQNELMTGSVGASNAPVSRFTLALYEDSG